MATEPTNRSRGEGIVDLDQLMKGARWRSNFLRYLPLSTYTSPASSWRFGEIADGNTTSCQCVGGGASRKATPIPARSCERWGGREVSVGSARGAEMLVALA